MNQNNDNKKLLIILASTDDREPQWTSLIDWTAFEEEETGFSPNSSSISSYFAEVDKELSSFLYQDNTVQIKNNDNLKNLLTKLYDFFYSKKKLIDLANYKRIVFCGHFHVGMSEVRKNFQEICDKSSNDIKCKLEKFKNPIFGKGNMIFESYPIGGDFSLKLKELIAELKEITTKGKKNPSGEEEKKISSIFMEIFDFCWDNVKIAPLVELILKIKTQLFVRYHSDGKCADELKKLLTQLPKYKDILKQSTGGDSIIEKLDLENAMIDSDKLKDIDKTLESILANILNKRDGAEKQSQSQAN